MTKFFKKSKKPYFGAILGPFYPNLRKNEFCWKKGCQFLKLPIIYHHTKNKKKLMTHSGETNAWTDRQTDRETDRQTE